MLIILITDINRVSYHLLSYTLKHTHKHTVETYILNLRT